MAVEHTIIEWQLLEDTREKLRVAVLMKWAEEVCGSAKDFQRYRYNVEQLPNGGLVYLHRPTFLNKGCDFLVHCDPAIPRDDGKRFKNPRHVDLSRELKLISEQITDGYDRVLAAVEAVWRCNDVTIVCASLCDGIDNSEWAFRAERALKVAKWLFVEQDITDWNTSGRGMLMDEIRDMLRR
jgi:hypothetical protein